MPGAPTHGNDPDAEGENPVNGEGHRTPEDPGGNPEKGSLCGGSDHAPANWPSPLVGHPTDGTALGVRGPVEFSGLDVPTSTLC